MLTELERLHLQFGFARRISARSYQLLINIYNCIIDSHLRHATYVNNIKVLAGNGKHVEGASGIRCKGDICHRIGYIINSLNFDALSGIFAVVKEEHFARGRGRFIAAGL